MRSEFGADCQFGFDGGFRKPAFERNFSITENSQVDLCQMYPVIGTPFQFNKFKSKIDFIYLESIHFASLPIPCWPRPMWWYKLCHRNYSFYIVFSSYLYFYSIERHYLVHACIFLALLTCNWVLFCVIFSLFRQEFFNLFWFVYIFLLPFSANTLTLHSITYLRVQVLSYGWKNR